MEGSAGSPSAASSRLLPAHPDYNLLQTADQTSNTQEDTRQRPESVRPEETHQSVGNTKKGHKETLESAENPDQLCFIKDLTQTDPVTTTLTPKPLPAKTEKLKQDPHLSETQDLKGSPKDPPCILKPELPKPSVPKPDSPKPSIPKPDSPKPSIPKPDSPKPSIPKPDSPKPSVPKPDTARTSVLKLDSPKPSEPKLDSPKPSVPKPDSRKPSVPKPDTAKPSVPNSDTAKPSVLKPESPKPFEPKPDTAKPSVPKPDTAKPSALKTDSPKPSVPNSDTAKLSVLKPQSPKPFEPKPDSPKPSVPKPDTARTSVLKPDSPKPSEPKLDSPKPSVPKPESPKPIEPKPVPLKPSFPKPDSSKPSVPNPDTAKPSVLKPESPKPFEPNPDTTKPSVLKPESPKPSVPKPDTARTFVLKPDSPKPSEPKLDSPKPSVPKPESSKPIEPKPVSLKPSFLKPDSQKPSITKLGPQKPSIPKPLAQKPSEPKPPLDLNTDLTPPPPHLNTEQIPSPPLSQLNTGLTLSPPYLNTKLTPPHPNKELTPPPPHLNYEHNPSPQNTEQTPPPPPPLQKTEQTLPPQLKTALNSPPSPQLNTELTPSPPHLNTELTPLQQQLNNEQTLPPPLHLNTELTPPPPHLNTEQTPPPLHLNTEQTPPPPHLKTALNSPPSSYLKTKQTPSPPPSPQLNKEFSPSPPHLETEKTPPPPHLNIEQNAFPLNPEQTLPPPSHQNTEQTPPSPPFLPPHLNTELTPSPPQLKTEQTLSPPYLNNEQNPSPLNTEHTLPPPPPHPIPVLTSPPPPPPLSPTSPPSSYLNTEQTSSPTPLPPSPELTTEQTPSPSQPNTEQTPPPHPESVLTSPPPPPLFSTSPPSPYLNTEQTPPPSPQLNTEQTLPPPSHPDTEQAPPPPTLHLKTEQTPPSPPLLPTQQNTDLTPSPSHLNTELTPSPPQLNNEQALPPPPHNLNTEHTPPPLYLSTEKTPPIHLNTEQTPPPPPHNLETEQTPPPHNLDTEQIPPPPHNLNTEQTSPPPHNLDSEQIPPPPHNLNTEQTPPPPHNLNTEQTPPPPHNLNTEQTPPPPHNLNTEQTPPPPHNLNTEQTPPPPHLNTEQTPPPPHLNTEQTPPLPLPKSINDWKEKLTLAPLAPPLIDRPTYDQEQSCPPASTSGEPKLCGYLQKQAGPLRAWKERWFSYEEKKNQLFYFRTHQDVTPLGRVELCSATFTYPLNAERGTFHIRTPERTFILKAVTQDLMLYWLQQLQVKRWQHRQKTADPDLTNNNFTDDFLPAMKSPVGLVGEGAANTQTQGMALTNMSLKHPLITIQNSVHSRKRSSQELSQSIFHVETPSQTHLDPAVTNSAGPPTTSTLSEPQTPHPVLPSAEPTGQVNPVEHRKSPLLDSSPRRTKSRSMMVSRKDTMSSVQASHLLQENQMLEEEVKAQKELVCILHKALASSQLEKRTCAEFLAATDEQERLELMRHRERQVADLQARLEEAREEAERARRNQAQSEAHVIELQDRVRLLEQKNATRQEVIVKLSDQLTTCMGARSRSSKCDVDSQTFRQLQQQIQNMQDDMEAYQTQNRFLNSEIQRLTHLWRTSSEMEKNLMVKCANLEAGNCKVESRYLSVLRQLHEVKALDPVQRAAVQKMIEEALKGELKSAKPNLAREYDEYGFKIIPDYEVEDMKLLAKIQALEIRSHNLLHQERGERLLTARWAQYLAGRSDDDPVHSPELKGLLRAGIPQEYRQQVWRWLVQARTRTIREHHPQRYQQLCEQSRASSQPAFRQIQLDLHRTLTTNQHFTSPFSPALQQLRRILLAFSWQNPAIGYCQGLNRLAALALLVLQSEEDAFWCLVAVVEAIMPHDYYTKNLVASQADQRVLKDLMSEKLPRLMAHFEDHSIDVSLVTFNWFLVVFVESLPSDILLPLWDAFLYEGTKVLFRYALAVFKYKEEDIMKIRDSVEIYQYLRFFTKTISDSRKLISIAFSDMNPFPGRLLRNRRAFHLERLQLELHELEEQQRLFVTESAEHTDKELDAGVSEDDDDLT